MPVTFPLDKIPGLPNIAVSGLIDIIVKFINGVQKKIEDLISDAAKLPDDVDCDDPRVQDLLDRIKKVQELMAKVQKIIPIIDKIIKAANILIGVASAIKASVFLTPIVGQAALLGELAIVQNMIIANAGIAVKQLRALPPMIQSSMESAIAGGLGDVAVGLGGICGNQSQIDAGEALQNAINNVDLSDSIPEGTEFGTGGDSSFGFGSGGGGGWALANGTGQGGPPVGAPPNPPSPYKANGNTWIWQGTIDPGTGVAWGSEESRQQDATMGSEFYNELNVDIPDLAARVDAITDIVEQQRDLLKSLQEAPAQSYSGDGAPDLDLGKIGDYYIDTTNSIIYGPKVKLGWPEGVNF